MYIYVYICIYMYIYVYINKMSMNIRYNDFPHRVESHISMRFPPWIHLNHGGPWVVCGGVEVVLE